MVMPNKMNFEKVVFLHFVCDRPGCDMLCALHNIDTVSCVNMLPWCRQRPSHLILSESVRMACQWQVNAATNHARV